MTMTFSADSSGTFGTIEINGVPQIEVHNDGSIKTPAGKLIASSQGMVGTASQSGGLPTGAFIESGSSANGRYTKFADGTLICTKRHNTVNTGYSLWSFPATFSSAPSVVGNILHTAVSPTSYVVKTLEDGVINPLGGRYIAAVDAAGAYVGAQVDLIAVGRWFQ